MIMKKLVLNQRLPTFSEVHTAMKEGKFTNAQIMAVTKSLENKEQKQRI